MDGYLRFVFLTGITKFSQLSIFSELNNLTNISMDDRYASICGITEEELTTQLRPELEDMASALGCSDAEAIQRLKKRYDGYHFSENCPGLFNPLSLLRSLSEKKLKSYWFETATPTALAEQLHKFNPLDPEILMGIITSARVRHWEIRRRYKGGKLRRNEYFRKQ